MAYGLKYELLCTSKKGNLYKTKIYFDGYVGAEIDRNVPVSPFKLKKDKADVIRGTSLEYSIREEVDFEFLEFYSNSNKKIKVELYKNTTLLWVGYNIPQQYQVPYVPSPSSISFTATDGLGLLKNEAFTLVGNNSQLTIIRHCVDKIGLALGYSIALNLFEASHNTTYSPLAQTYEDSDTFAGLNCYEVLESILGKYNAEITQRRSRWAITCSVDKKSTRMLYTSAGVYEGTEAAPGVLDLGYPGTDIEVTPKGILQLSLEPGGKQVKIKQDFGRKDSLLSNYKFTQFASAAFSSWNKEGSFLLYQKETEDGSKYAQLSGYSQTDEYIYQTVPITNVPGEDFVFFLKFAAIGRVFTSLTGTNPTSMEVKCLVYVDDGTNYYCLTKSGWGAANESHDIVMSVPSSISQQCTFNELKILTSEIPCSGTLYVRLYRFNHVTAHAGYTYNGVAFKDVCAYFLNAGELYPGSVETIAKFDNSTEPTDLSDVNLLNGDAPDLTNKSLLYEKLMRLIDGSPTVDWLRLGSSSEYSFLIQFARILASENKIARQKLTGDIKGAGIEFDSIIKHTYNSNREFEIAEAIWDLFEETYSVTLLELLPWTDEAITFTTESKLSSTSSGNSSSNPSSMPVGNSSGEVTSIALVDLLEVDGEGSGLDADMLDGQHGNFYAPIDSPSFTTQITTPKIYGSSDADGDLIIEGTSHATKTSSCLYLQPNGGYVIYGGATNIGSSTFTSGFAGSGWSNAVTAGEHTLTIDNLVVRKEMSVYQMDINKISSINGGMVISAANGKCLNVSGTTIYFDEDGTSKQIQFQVNDYIRAQVYTGRGVASYVGLVTAVNHSATYGSANIVATTVSGTPWDGMDLVQIGNSSDTARQNIIYITASDTNNPYIDMLAGVNAGSFAGKQKLRIGNLAGITDADFGGALSGYGLYANNVYLKGKLQIAAGTTGYSNINDKPTIPTNTNQLTDGAGLGTTAAWSGVSGTGKPQDNANYTTNTNQLTDGANLGGTATWTGIANRPVRFADTPAGAGLCMTASYMGYYDGGEWKSYIDSYGNCKFVGIAELGTDWEDGTSGVMGISLKGNDIYEGHFNDHGGNIWINRIGQNGGTTYGRDLRIGNGMGGYMAEFQGYYNIFNLYCNFYSNTGVLVDFQDATRLRIPCNGGNATRGSIFLNTDNHVYVYLDSSNYIVLG